MMWISIATQKVLQNGFTTMDIYKKIQKFSESMVKSLIFLRYHSKTQVYTLVMVYIFSATDILLPREDWLYMVGNSKPFFGFKIFATQITHHLSWNDTDNSTTSNSCFNHKNKQLNYQNSVWSQ